MEEREGCSRFFFADGVDKFYATVEYIHGSNSSLYEGGKHKRFTDPKVSFVSAIQKIQRQRVNFNIGVANRGIGGVDYDKLVRKTIKEYTEYISFISKIKTPK